MTLCPPQARALIMLAFALEENFVMRLKLLFPPVLGKNVMDERNVLLARSIARTANRCLALFLLMFSFPPSPCGPNPFPPLRFGDGHLLRILFSFVMTVETPSLFSIGCGADKSSTPSSFFSVLFPKFSCPTAFFSSESSEDCVFAGCWASHALFDLSSLLNEAPLFPDLARRRAQSMKILSFLSFLLGSTVKTKDRPAITHF